MILPDLLVHPRSGPARRRFAPLLAAVLMATAVPAAVLASAPAPAGAAGDPEACFTQASHRTFLGRDATTSELGAWTSAFIGGTPHHVLPSWLANTGEWLGVEASGLYRAALDREPDPAGLDHWVDELGRGVLVNRIAAQIYGSEEFYANAGGTDDAFIGDLYARILHRSPDAGGLAHWRTRVNDQGRGWVAASFFASIESRTDRVTSLYDRVLSRAPEPGGRAYWAERLRSVNDVALAVALASSTEFFSRAQPGCELTVADEVTFTGHGWGHGRGMGQYGALGYAIDHDWSTGAILDHFYGGTSASTMSWSPTQRVYLTASRGETLTVTQSAGVLRVDGHGADLDAVRIARIGADRFRVWRGSGCGGPWTHIGDRSAGEVEVRSRLSVGDDTNRMLQRCDGGTRYYRGSLLAVDALGTIVTVNRVGTEAMLASIVPAEVPAYWADLDGGRGAAAVRAQAVAARSYALAGDIRWGDWATTCDSTTCQVYRGYGTRGSGSGSINRHEDPRTSAAVAATAHRVRRHANGAIARTEFSSSTGGWTAGGTFPAVRDQGDDVGRNPNHTWTRTVSVAEIEGTFDQRAGRDMGRFAGFEAWQRNGLGEGGGRVASVRARFSGGTVSVTGDQMRWMFGLRSGWFSA